MDDNLLGKGAIILASGHIDRTAEILAMTPHTLVGLGGSLGIGKTYHRELLEESSFRDRFIHVQYDCEHFLARDYYDIYGGMSLLDPDEGKPEWEKRRNASARAKQELISKMKARRNAR